MQEKEFKFLSFFFKQQRGSLEHIIKRFRFKAPSAGSREAD
jgi:hypothetical protein